METPKPELEKSDLIDTGAAIPIPAIPETPGDQLKAETSITTKNISSQSKIPKRDVGNPVPKTLPDQKKQFSKKFPNTLGKNGTTSSSAVNLALPEIKTSLATSRSTLLSQRSAKSREHTPRYPQSGGATDKTEKADRAAAKRNLMAFENIRDKVRNYQTDFLAKFEAVKDSLPAGEKEYELVGLVKKNEVVLLAKNAQKAKIKYAQTTLADFKKDIEVNFNNNLNRVLDSLDILKNEKKVGDNSPRSLETLNVLEDIENKFKAANKTTLNDILRQLDTFEPCDKSVGNAVNNSDHEEGDKNLVKIIDDLRKNLEQKEEELVKLKEGKEISFQKELEEKTAKLTRKQKECQEFKKKMECLEKDLSNERVAHKDLQEKLKAKAAEVDDLNERIRKYAEANSKQQSKILDQDKRIRKLEADLTAAQKDMENRAQIEHSIGDQATKRADEIQNLKEDLSMLTKDKEKLEKEVQYLKKELKTQTELSTELYSQQTNESQSFNIPEDIQEELASLRNSVSEQRKKIQSLEISLTKAKLEKKKLEEDINMKRMLLQARSKIIDSLQIKENSQKVRLEDIFVQLDERNSDIQMLKTEVLTKTEEFQNLFSTLSAKQIELTKQEHVIKLLGESNERMQKLRAKQESKIGSLEETVARLTQTLSIYQDAVLPTNNLKANLLMVNDDTDAYDNSDYYIEARRRKRHIDINVKKYEK